MLKALIKDDASKTLGLDILFVMDCCHSAIAGRGGKVGARVELTAATSPNGISKDGYTFTQYFCDPFRKLLNIGEKFTCADIMSEINAHPKQDQYGQASSFFKKVGNYRSPFVRPLSKPLPRKP
jgi:hypothetical protein